jgi:copper chaperone CopZ
MQRVKFSGLHCDACNKLISKRLAKIEGVNEVNVTNEKGVFEVKGTAPITQAQIEGKFGDSEYKLISIGEV